MSKEITKTSRSRICSACGGLSGMTGGGFTLIRKPYDGLQGFTLIEVMMSAALMVVLGGSVLGLQYILSNSQLTAFNSYTAVEEANSIVASFTSELRAIQQADTGAYPIEVADDNQVVFFSDIDYDGVVERVRYTATGTQMVKGVTEPSGTPLTYDLGTESTRVMTQFLNDSITTPIFLYFNGDWPNDLTNNPLLPGSRLSDTRLVRISINMRIASQVSEDTFALESHVQPRALKY